MPDPVLAAAICESCGCDSIVAHLREDRRHINDNDAQRLRKTVKTRFNLEMSIADEIVDIACRLKPDQATLVPEKRTELTTEGGLNVITGQAKLKKVIRKLSLKGIAVSLFIDPDIRQISAVPKTGAKIIELHTGRYALAGSRTQRLKRLNEIIEAAQFAQNAGLIVNAGHALDYNNVAAIAGIAGIEELNIGYSIICRSLFTGLEKAVKEMIGLVNPAFTLSGKTHLSQGRIK